MHKTVCIYKPNACFSVIKHAGSHWGQTTVWVSLATAWGTNL